MDGDYTLAEVATLMRKSTDLVADMARAGNLPGAYQLVPRGRWSVRRLDFDRWHAGLGPQQDDPYRLEPPSRRSISKRKATR